MSQRARENERILAEREMSLHRTLQLQDLAIKLKADADTKRGDRRFKLRVGISVSNRTAWTGGVVRH